MNVAAIERDFTAWLAVRLRMEVDKEIYRGSIPDGVDYGVGVVFGSEEKSAGFYGFRPRAWNVQVLGKFADRDEAMAFQTYVNGLFPNHGFTLGETKFLSVYPAGSGEPYIDDDGGQIRYLASINVVVTVLTSGTQVDINNKGV